MNKSLYWDSHQLCICLQIWSGICIVPTAEAVATGEVNCYNFTVGIRSLPQIAEMISQGYNSIAQRPLTCENASNPLETNLRDTPKQIGWSVSKSLKQTGQQVNECVSQAAKVCMCCGKQNFLWLWNFIIRLHFHDNLFWLAYPVNRLINKCSRVIIHMCKDPPGNTCSSILK